MGLPLTDIIISQEIEPDKWFTFGKITTDKHGKASMYLGGSHKTGNWQFHIRHQSGEYEDAEITDHYEAGQEHYIEHGLVQIGYEEDQEQEKALGLTWNAQTEIEKLAMSFVSALAIIMAFKVLQGFDMGRVNPVS